MKIDNELNEKMFFDGIDFGWESYPCGTLSWSDEANEDELSLCIALHTISDEIFICYSENAKEEFDTDSCLMAIDRIRDLLPTISYGNRLKYRSYIQSALAYYLECVVGVPVFSKIYDEV